MMSSISVMTLLLESYYTASEICHFGDYVSEIKY